MEHQLSQLAPVVLVTPLWLHDVCTLALGRRLGVPVIGVLTSRVGAWWAWAQLGALPDLASAEAPTGGVLGGGGGGDSTKEGGGDGGGDSGFYARATNLVEHYAFMSTMRQRWQAPAISSLPPDWQLQPLPAMYRNLHRLLVVWDPLLHPTPPHTPAAVPIGGFAADLDTMSKVGLTI